MFELSRLYNNFKLRKWKKLSTEKKVAVFQEIENILAKKQDRPVCRIVVEDLEEGVGGRHIVSTHTIKIDSDKFFDNSYRFFLLSIYFHETRHSFQRDQIADKEKHHFLSREYRWKKTFDGYVNIKASGDTFSYYAMQDVERDADKYALKQLKKLRLKFLFSKDFKRTLTYRIKDYKETVKQAKKELGFFYRFKVAFNNFKQRRRNKKNKS